MLAIAAANLSHLRGGDERWFLELVRWMDENLPPGTAVAATCSPGGVGNFSEHPVFALDGLTGDFAFHERAAELGLREALAELGIGYVYSFGPRSTEVAHFARITEARGHGGEAVAFYATPEGDGESRLRAIGLVSPLIGRDVATICLGPDLLVGEGFPGRRMGIWKLPDDDGCAARSTGDRLSP
jgi:hypothetical protein